LAFGGEACSIQSYTRLIHREGLNEMDFIKHYWYGILGGLVIVVLMGLMIGGVIQP
jgi:hypothetical protein